MWAPNEVLLPKLKTIQGPNGYERINSVDFGPSCVMAKDDG